MANALPKGARGVTAIASVIVVTTSLAQTKKATVAASRLSS